MFEDILQRMREKVQQNQYIMTIHADEEMADDNLMLTDIEQVFLIGKIVERQKDRNTDAWKYRIQGRSLDGALVEIIAKLGVSGKLIIITVYSL